MKNAKELMLEYTAFSFRDPKKAAEMFTEDGAFQLPYLATFGLPTEYRGRDAIAALSAGPRALGLGPRGVETSPWLRRPSARRAPGSMVTPTPQRRRR